MFVKLLTYRLSNTTHLFCQKERKKREKDAFLFQKYIINYIFVLGYSPPWLQLLVLTEKFSWISVWVSACECAHHLLSLCAWEIKRASPRPRAGPYWLRWYGSFPTLMIIYSIQAENLLNFLPAWSRSLAFAIAVVSAFYLSFCKAFVGVL